MTIYFKQKTLLLNRYSQNKIIKKYLKHENKKLFIVYRILVNIRVIDRCFGDILQQN